MDYVHSPCIQTLFRICEKPTFEPEAEIRIVYYPIEGIEFTQKDVSVSDLKMNVKKHYEILWIKGLS